MPNSTKRPEFAAAPFRGGATSSRKNPEADERKDRSTDHASSIVIELIPLPFEIVELAAHGDLGFIAAAPNLAAIRPLVQEIALAYVGHYRRTQAKVPWIGYLAKNAITGEIVGTCGFKDRKGQGEIEIAYFTFPDFERRGHATRMARSLIDIASQYPERRPIIAHTLPAENASTRILQRLGFICVGPIEDAEDGTMWRWEVERGGATRCK